MVFRYLKKGDRSSGKILNGWREKGERCACSRKPTAMGCQYDRSIPCTWHMMQQIYQWNKPVCSGMWRNIPGLCVLAAQFYLYELPSPRFVRSYHKTLMPRHLLQVGEIWWSRSSLSVQQALHQAHLLVPQGPLSGSATGELSHHHRLQHKNSIKYIK